MGKRFLQGLCRDRGRGERFHWEMLSNVNIARTWAHDSIIHLYGIVTGIVFTTHGDTFKEYKMRLLSTTPRTVSHAYFLTIVFALCLTYVCAQKSQLVFLKSVTMNCKNNSVTMPQR